MVIKYFVNNWFAKDKFVNLLKVSLNVPAVAVEDGIILDRGVFNAIPDDILPRWAKINKEDINSPLHTRKANTKELRLLISKPNYQLIALYQDHWTTILENSSIDTLKAQAGVIIHADTVAIMDTATGEIVYETERYAAPSEKDMDEMAEFYGEA